MHFKSNEHPLKFTRPPLLKNLMPSPLPRHNLTTLPPYARGLYQPLRPCYEILMTILKFLSDTFKESMTWGWGIAFLR